MDIGRICITDQKYLIYYLRRKDDTKVPDTPAKTLTRLIRDIDTKTDPSIVEYLINKGKSEEDITSFLGVEVSHLTLYT